MAQSASSSADVTELLRDFDARHQADIAVLQRELDERCRLFRDERRALLLGHLGDADAAVTAPTASAEAARTADALAFIAGAARRAVEGVLADGEVSRTLQGPTLDAPSLAEAYDAVHAAMTESSGSQSAAPHKQALLLMRDLLVLKVCLGSGRPWNNVGLELALSRAFDRPLEETLMSQFYQSFNKIICCGRDLASFDSTVSKRYGESLDQDTKEKLFEAFRACARTSPCHTSNTKEVHKGKPRPKPKQKKPQLGVDGGGGAEEDAAAADGPDLASGVATEEADAGPGATDSSERPSFDYPVPVRNTFVHYVDEVGSSCPSIGRSAKTCPPGLATVAEQEQAHSIASEAGSCDGLLVLEEEAGKSLAQRRDIQCKQCRAEDPDGWMKYKDKAYWCLRCWKKYNTTKGVDTGKYVHEPRILAVGGPGGPAEAFHDLDPAVVTEVRVKNQCCLRVAQECGKGACMLVNGREHGPLAEHKYGQAGTVIKSSTLQQAVRATENSDGTWACPWPGGIYVPDVLVEQAGDGSPFVTPFRVSMIYAAAPRSEGGAPGEDVAPANQDALAEELRKKILNVLRMCHQRGHKELVLGAWGCGWRNLPCRDVAKVFRKVLLEGSDVVGAFHRVTFAIKGCEEAEVFADVFELSTHAATMPRAVGSGGAGSAAAESTFQ